MRSLTRLDFLSSFDDIFEYLLTHQVPESKTDCCCDFYAEKIAIRRSIIRIKRQRETHSITLWRTKVLLNTWYNDINNPKSYFIGSINYTIHPYHIQIESLHVNDREFYDYYDSTLSIYESNQMIHWFISYMKYIAEKGKRRKVLIDVHFQLKLFNKYFYKEGFVVTSRKSRFNSFWYEAEYILPYSHTEIKKTVSAPEMSIPIEITRNST